MLSHQPHPSFEVSGKDFWELGLGFSWVLWDYGHKSPWMVHPP